MGFCTDGHLDLQKAVQAVKKGSSVGCGSVQRGYSDLKKAVQAVKKGSSIPWGSAQRGLSELDLQKVVQAINNNKRGGSWGGGGRGEGGRRGAVQSSLSGCRKKGSSVGFSVDPSDHLYRIPPYRATLFYRLLRGASQSWI